MLRHLFLQPTSVLQLDLNISSFLGKNQHEGKLYVISSIRMVMSTWIKFRWESTKSVYFLVACFLNVPVFLLAICLCQVVSESLAIERAHLSQRKLVG